MTGVTIVIVNYNVRHFILQCIESIYRSDLATIDLKIIVIDNASIDGSVAAIRDKYPEVDLIASQTNLGFGRANNLGINKAKTKYCLLLNPDTIVQEDTLRRCLAFMDINPSVAALGVKMVDGNGLYLRESKRSLPTALSSFYRLTKLNEIFPSSTYFNSYYTKDLSGDKDEYVEVLCGAFMFCNTNTLQDLGGFDEDFFMYGEDIDLSKRMLEAGHLIAYLGSTRIIHFKGESSKKSSVNYLHSFYNAMIIYVNKHNKSNSAILTKFILKFAIVLSGLLRSIKEVLHSIIQPLLTFVSIFFSLQSVKDLWSKYYFGIEAYYKEDFIINNIFYSTIWVLSLWFWGWFDGYRKLKSLFFAIVFGTLMILIFYALFPLQYRSSRVLIIIGAIITTFIAVAFEIIKSIFLKDSSRIYSKSNLVIVGHKDHGNAIVSQLEDQKYNFNLIGIVNPDTTVSDSEYLNDTRYLPEIVKMYKVNEIIFSHRSMSSEKIMDLMTISDSSIKYKIADTDTQSIIGSDSSKVQSSIYDTYSNYNLSKAVYRRVKRLFDLFISSFFIITLPLFILNKKFRTILMSNILTVLSSRKTWVGYSNQSNTVESSKLPQYKEGVIKLNDKVAPKEYPRLLEKNLNNWYSKSYTPFIDLEVIKNYLL